MFHGRCYRSYFQQQAKDAKAKYSAEGMDRATNCPGGPVHNVIVLPSVRCPNCRRSNAHIIQLPKKRQRPFRKQIVEAQTELRASRVALEKWKRWLDVEERAAQARAAVEILEWSILNCKAGIRKLQQKQPRTGYDTTKTAPFPTIVENEAS